MKNNLKTKKMRHQTTRTTQNPGAIITDKCVLCGAPTVHPAILPTYLRVHYVEAVGQLCEKCYNINQNPKK